MEKMTEKEAMLECIHNELYEIKCHLCNERYFEGGVGLGGLMNLVLNAQYVEQEKRKRGENEEVQEKECDEECEESSEEEDGGESEEKCCYSDYLDIQRSLRISEERVDELMKKIAKLEKENGAIKSTKRAIFDLQDLVMRLIKFKKIDSMEWPHVINILRNTGVEECDIKILCHMEEK